MLPGGGKKGAPRTATASGRRRRRHFDSFANTVLAKNKCWIFQQTRGWKIKKCLNNMRVYVLKTPFVMRIENLKV
jgi:hypothetical protein